MHKYFFFAFHTYKCLYLHLLKLSWDRESKNRLENMKLFLYEAFLFFVYSTWRLPAQVKLIIYLLVEMALPHTNRMIINSRLFISLPRSLPLKQSRLSFLYHKSKARIKKVCRRIWCDIDLWIIQRNKRNDLNFLGDKIILQGCERES